MFKIAKKRDRILAFVIDGLIYFTFCFLFIIIFGTLDKNALEVKNNLNGFPAILLIFIGLFLWPITEGLFAKTIGKRIVGLKIVSEKYAAINIKTAFLRFTFSAFDYFFYRIICSFI